MTPSEGSGFEFALLERAESRRHPQVLPAALPAGVVVDQGHHSVAILCRRLPPNEDEVAILDPSSIHGITDRPKQEVPVGWLGKFD